MSATRALLVALGRAQCVGELREAGWLTAEAAAARLVTIAREFDGEAEHGGDPMGEAQYQRKHVGARWLPVQRCTAVLSDGRQCWLSEGHDGNARGEDHPAGMVTFPGGHVYREKL